MTLALRPCYFLNTFLLIQFVSPHHEQSLLVRTFSVFEVKQKRSSVNLSYLISFFTIQVQFLDPAHIDQFRHIVSVWDIPVIAYGLRTDFRTNFFPGSLRLMELADNIEEVSKYVRVEKIVSQSISPSLIT